MTDIPKPDGRKFNYGDRMKCFPDEATSAAMPQNPSPGFQELIAEDTPQGPTPPKPMPDKIGDMTLSDVGRLFGGILFGFDGEPDLSGPTTLKEGQAARVSGPAKKSRKKGK